MNWEHLKAFLWLRWRLIANRNRRAGNLSVILQGILTVVMICAAVFSFVGGILAGYLALPKAPPAIFMFVWDGVVIGFLFMWGIELMIELQRSELLSLDKFMHLPVSLNGAFLINYIGSISGMGVIIFMPLMTGLAIGLVFSKGLIMLLLFPLIFAFALMVTSLTHQFKGWLASLMVNQRRRRTIISVITFSFILLFQLPNIIGFTSGRWRRNDPISEQGKANRKTIENLDRALARKEITKTAHDDQVKAIRGPAREEERQAFYETVRLVSTFVPLGWLPIGAVEGFEGKPGMALAGIAGLTLIGVLSLRRSYRTTLRLYTGQFSGKTPATSAASAAPTATAASAAMSSTKKTGKYPAAFLEKRFPRVNESAAVIAVACFRTHTRAPEAKMMMLSPLITLFIFGAFTRGTQSNIPELLLPLMTVGGLTFMLFMLVGVLGNVFAFDRSGFRVFVLSPAPRRDILFGKNLSTAPIGIGFMLIAAIAMQWMHPMRVDHYLAVLLQILPMYLIYCLVGNVLSIIAPMPMAAGSMKPHKPKGMTILIHLAFMFVFPIALAPTLLPLGIEYLLTVTGTLAWFPAYLLFTIAELAFVVWLYFRLLDEEGKLLSRHEQKVLEVVTAKVE